MLSDYLSGESDLLSVGVVGAGHIARLYHLPILANVDAVETAFIADLEESKARQLATTYGGRPIATGNAADLPDCDIALLAVPVGVREEYVETLGKRGTSVFSEKPFAMTATRHERLDSLVDDVACNYMRLNFQSTRQLKHLVESRLLGDLERVVVEEGGIVGATGKGGGHYQTDPSLSGGGILIQNGCHPLSQLAYVLEDWDLTVDRSDVVCKGGFDIDVDAELRASTGGREVTVEFRISQIRRMRNELELQFERGTVTFDPSDPTATLSISTPSDAAGIDSLSLRANERWATDLEQAHYLRWEAFLDWLSDDGAAPPLRTGRPITDLIESIYEAGGVERDL